LRIDTGAFTASVLGPEVGGGAALEDEKKAEESAIDF
jgi:hypothetical protein